MELSKIFWVLLFLFINAVTLYITWRVFVWTYKKYFPKPTPTINQAVKNSSGRSLIEMKKLLDEKIISQDEFDEYKKKHLDNLKAS